MRILIIEDDSTLNTRLVDHLNQISGYQADSAENFKDGEYMIGIRNYDLVVSSLTLPDGECSEIITAAKRKSSKTIVIVISSKNDKNSEIKAFRNGADDYMKKPIDADVLVARIDARLRLNSFGGIRVGDLTISPDEEKVIYKGYEVELKGKPFEVLTHLARHLDQVVSKEQLLDAIWEEPELVTPNVIEVAINQIRQRLDKPLGISTVETVRRRGYRFCFSDKD